MTLFLSMDSVDVKLKKVIRWMSLYNAIDVVFKAVLIMKMNRQKYN